MGLKCLLTHQNLAKEKSGIIHMFINHASHIAVQKNSFAISLLMSYNGLIGPQTHMGKSHYLAGHKLKFG
jgi:hypothetical protein